MNYTIINLTNITIGNYYNTQNICEININKIITNIQYGVPKVTFWLMLTSIIIMFLMINWLINYKDKKWYEKINNMAFSISYLITLYATLILGYTIYKPNTKTIYIILGIIIILITSYLLLKYKKK